MYKKVDVNQREIVKYLRKIGASVQVLSEIGKGCPDLLVGFRGKNFLFEVKDGKRPPSQRQLTEHEKLFFYLWRGQVCVVNSIEEAMQFLNADIIN